jgi:hypothetical protein
LKNLKIQVQQDRVLNYKDGDTITKLKQNLPWQDMNPIIDDYEHMYTTKQKSNCSSFVKFLTELCSE